MDKIKTVLVDDDIRALKRMNILLGFFTEIEIIEQFSDAENSIDFIIENEPDLVFLDIEMPGTTGLDVADKLALGKLHTKIIFVTSFDHYAINAIKKNAFDYLLKPVSIDDLKKSIERYKATIHSNLTKREYEIIRLIAKGYNSKKIGEQLFISHHTVDTYRRLILEKTGCKNSAELISFASKNNLV
ncbi:MAG: response regulator transcription factor [Bacteroidales bacterium]